MLWRFRNGHFVTALTVLAGITKKLVLNLIYARVFIYVCVVYASVHLYVCGCTTVLLIFANPNTSLNQCVIPTPAPLVLSSKINGTFV